MLSSIVEQSHRKKVLFLTGTRADFGKQKPLILELQNKTDFEVHVFVTGMHTLSRYGATWDEVRKSGVEQFHIFINQGAGDGMDLILSKTISGLSDYVKELTPDLIVIHGDRLEALAGSIVGTFNNILVAHIEGGEVSGTVDEAIRHSVSKLSHIHFVSNEEARVRLRAMGELPENIHTIGSPDLDILKSGNLPSIGAVKEKYEINFDSYAILLFHPVTTELELLVDHLELLISTLETTPHSFVVIYPNNDPGNDLIIEKYNLLHQRSNYKIIPSMRFEYFLTLMKHCLFMIGNSSAGVREAPFFGIPAINVGTRQNGRASSQTIFNCDFDASQIITGIEKASGKRYTPVRSFGDGESTKKFREIMEAGSIFNIEIQKQFCD